MKIYSLLSGLLFCLNVTIAEQMRHLADELIQAVQPSFSAHFDWSLSAFVSRAFGTRPKAVGAMYRFAEREAVA